MVGKLLVLLECHWLEQLIWILCQLQCAKLWHSTKFIFMTGNKSIFTVWGKAEKNVDWGGLGYIRHKLNIFWYYLHYFFYDTFALDSNPGLHAEKFNVNVAWIANKTGLDWFRKVFLHMSLLLQWMENSGSTAGYEPVQSYSQAR